MIAPSKKIQSCQTVSVEKHRHTIVAMACYQYRMKPELFIRAPKNKPPWDELATVTAFTLKRDTRADPATIATLISCSETEVENFVTRGEKAGVAGTDSRIVESIARLKSAVRAQLQMGGTDWKPAQRSAKCEESDTTKSSKDFTEKVKAAILTECPKLTMYDLLGYGPGHMLAAARDVFFAIVAATTGNGYEKVGDPLGRCSIEVTPALGRMRKRDGKRLALLVSVCTRLEIDHTIVLAWLDKKRKT